MDTKHLAILLTDIKGFTSRTASRSRDKLAEFLETHEKLVLPVITRFKGRLVKNIGDAFLATFESPTNAVLCGAAIQKRLKEHNSACAVEDRIEVRIAVNSGEVSVAEDGDVFGSAVNVTARLESAAQAGEVYFTEAVYLTMNRAEVPSREVGCRQFRGVPDKVRIFKVLDAPAPGGAEAPEDGLPMEGVPAEGVSEKARREARRRFRQGLEAYFGEFDFSAALSCMKDAVQLDPRLVDAHLMAAVCAGNIGDEVERSSVARRLRGLLRDEEDAKSRLKIPAVLAYLDRDPAYPELAARCRRRNPKDPYMDLLEYHAAARRGDHAGARASLRRWTRFYPGASVFARYAEAEHQYGIMADPEKALELFRKLIADRPEVVNFRMGMFFLLLSLKRLQEAKDQLAEALKIDPANEFLQVFAAELALHRGEREAGHNYLRSLIGLSKAPDSWKSCIYYRLYLSSRSWGNKAEAERHLAMAQGIGPQWEWESVERIEERAASFAIPASLYPEIPPERFGLVADRIRAAWVANDTSGILNVGAGYLACFDIRSARECRKSVFWAGHNMSPEEIKGTRVLLDSVPSTPFMDADGNILHADFERTPCVHWPFSAAVTCARPVQHHETAFMTAQFDASSALRPREDRICFEVDESRNRWGNRTYVVIVPQDMALESVSLRPDETLEAGGAQMLVYARFFYVLEKFRLNIRLRL
ncbi:MAG: tetratricopeptide repeat protein [Elusimicrobia bacterium]|nr:tetratricopeptide repeat protein [Elusimicrobiota bacterium]